MNSIELDASEEFYLVGGKKVPRLTRIIADAGLIDSTWFTEQHSKRGRYVHKATELDDLRTLDEAKLSPILRPYLEGWRSFRRDTDFLPAYIEHRVAYFQGERPAFGCTVDRFGDLGGDAAIVEIKSGALYPWGAIQTAGQEMAYRSQEPRAEQRPIKRFGLRLFPDGKYKLLRHDDPDDFNVMVSALNLYNWKLAHGN